VVSNFGVEIYRRPLVPVFGQFVLGVLASALLCLCELPSSGLLSLVVRGALDLSSLLESRDIVSI